MAGSMVYRNRVGASDEPHMERFRDAMRAAQDIADNRGYNHIAGFHGAPGWYCWHHQFSQKTPLQARLFLPWHRAYLWHLEQALQDQVLDTALPWWDWTQDRGIPQAYASRRVDGQANPLYDSRAVVPSANPPINHRTTRSPSAPAWLPTEAEVDALLNETDWAAFSDLLQSVHDGVHGWVGGDMASVTTAAFDPIFFAHHCMIDRIWYLWQVAHGNGGVPVSLLALDLPPFNKRFEDVLDTQALGYEYASETTEIEWEDGGHG